MLLGIVTGNLLLKNLRPQYVFSQNEKAFMVRKVLDDHVQDLRPVESLARLSADEALSDSPSEPGIGLYLLKVGDMLYFSENELSTSMKVVGIASSGVRLFYEIRIEPKKGDQNQISVDSGTFFYLWRISSAETEEGH